MERNETVTLLLAGQPWRDKDTPVMLTGKVIRPAGVTPEQVIEAYADGKLPPVIVMRVEFQPGVPNVVSQGRMGVREVAVDVTWIAAIERLVDPGYRI